MSAVLVGMIYRVVLPGMDEHPDDVVPDGRYVSKEDYPDLYAVLEDKFGEETETEFRLPDLRVRVQGHEPTPTPYRILGRKGS